MSAVCKHRGAEVVKPVRVRDVAVPGRHRALAVIRIKFPGVQRQCASGDSAG